MNPSTNGAYGRDEHGRSALGKPGGPGNPHIRKQEKLRAMLLETAEDRLPNVVAKLFDLAEAGERSDRGRLELLPRLVM